MLSVKFDSPIIIEEKNLGALLTLAGVAARVEPYTEGAKPGRKPRVVAEAPAPEPQASAPEPVPVKEPAKRGPKPKVKEAAAAAPAATEEAEVVDSSSLRDRFSALIDKDFDGARGLLEHFGVSQFSGLSEGDFAAFSTKMAELETSA